MKTVLFLMFLVFTGCTSTGNSLKETVKPVSNRSKIIVRQDRNAGIRTGMLLLAPFFSVLLPYDDKEYQLLSVRGDSVIVVLDWEEHDVEPIPFSHARVLTKDSITMLFAYDKSRAVLTGALSGGLGFGLAVAVLGFLGMFNLSTQAPYSLSTYYTVVAGSVVIGAVTGAMIANADPRVSLSFESGGDREFLRSISAYPDKEPDEMKYIK